MMRISVATQDMICGECALALKHFIENMDGVEAVYVGRTDIVVAFDEGKLAGEAVSRVARENLEKLGHKPV